MQFKTTLYDGLIVSRFQRRFGLILKSFLDSVLLWIAITSTLAIFRGLKSLDSFYVTWIDKYSNNTER